MSARSLDIQARRSGLVGPIAGNTAPGGQRRRVDHLSVGCPACGAQAGSPCVSTESGEPLRVAHKPRGRMATRARNESIANTVATVETSLTPAERKRIRESAGFTQAELANLLKTHTQSISTYETSSAMPTDPLIRQAYASLMLLWRSA